MTAIKCPICDKELPSRELQEGWCGSCGKKVPNFVYHQAHLSGPTETALPSRARQVSTPIVLDPDEQAPLWQFALIGLGALALGAVIVWQFI